MWYGCPCQEVCDMMGLFVWYVHCLDIVYSVDSVDSVDIARIAPG